MAEGASLSVIWEGLKEAENRLQKIQAQADDASKEILTRSAAVLVGKSMANFEGAHPRGMGHQGGSKPNVVTGDTRRSIKMDPPRQVGRAEWVTQVGPRVAWGRRLDQGFAGADSTGRVYTQPAYPYFTPAVEESTPLFNPIAADVWRRMLM